MLVSQAGSPKCEQVTITGGRPCWAASRSARREDSSSTPWTRGVDYEQLVDDPVTLMVSGRDEARKLACAASVGERSAPRTSGCERCLQY
jgi:hypothetical protein